MKIAIGADHAGVLLKDAIKQHLQAQGHEVTDRGTTSKDSVDYPDFAEKVAHDVSERATDFGILVCGSGIGMAIAANKVPGVRAANITSEEEARMSREHNNLNVLTLGARILAEPKALGIVDTFLKTGFAYGRHENRVNKIHAIENGNSGK